MPDTETIAGVAKAVVETATAIADNAHAAVGSATSSAADSASQISDNAVELASAAAHDGRARYVAAGVVAVVGLTAVFVVLKRRRAASNQEQTPA